MSYLLSRNILSIKIEKTGAKARDTNGLTLNCVREEHNGYQKKGLKTSVDLVKQVE